ARRSALLSAERAKPICIFGECLWPRPLRRVFLQRTQSLFGIDNAANRILLVRIDGHESVAPALTVGVLPARAHEQPLHLPGCDAVFQLLRKLIWIGSGIKGLDNHECGGLMLTVIVSGDRMICD